jgi:hypothetical protein
MLVVWLIVHALWAAWMTLGVVLAVAANWRPRLWRMPVFRTTHLIGLLVTASVPLWSSGICPITNWEWASDQHALTTPEPFLVRMIRGVLYLDVPPWIFSVVTAVCALYCVVVYFLHPPWQGPGRTAPTSPQ